MPKQHVDTACLARQLQQLAPNLPPGLPADLATALSQPLALYLEMLCQWNTAMNLVGPRHWRDILQRLVTDSFHLAGFLSRLPLAPRPLSWDLGSGAGLPGIPLRMLWQEGEYYLVEVREKRALFLSSVLARLGWTHTHVFRGPVEKFFLTQPQKAHCIVSRAFMPWPALLDLTRPQLAPDGLLIILALTPPPDALPADCQLTDSMSYTIDDGTAQGSTRWFWALQPQAGAVC